MFCLFSVFLESLKKIENKKLTTASCGKKKWKHNIKATRINDFNILDSLGF